MPGLEAVKAHAQERYSQQWRHAKRVYPFAKISVGDGHEKSQDEEIANNIAGAGQFRADDRRCWTIQFSSHGVEGLGWGRRPHTLFRLESDYRGECFQVEA